MKTINPVLFFVGLAVIVTLGGYAFFATAKPKEEGKAAPISSAAASSANVKEYLDGKISRAECNRRNAELRRDDKSITDSERLAGIEYQLTLLRIDQQEARAAARR